MTDKRVDEAKGRAKEAAGALTDDQDLKREGQVDRAKSDVKDKAERVTDAAVDAAQKAKERLTRH